MELCDRPPVPVVARHHGGRPAGGRFRRLRDLLHRGRVHPGADADADVHGDADADAHVGSDGDPADRPDGAEGGVLDDGPDRGVGGRAAAPVPCYPFVRIGMADGTTQYYVAGVGFTTDPTPYLGFEAGTTTLVDPILGYAVLAESFSGIPAGAYVLEGGAVDAVRTTSAENLVYFGGIDREPLTVR